MLKHLKHLKPLKHTSLAGTVSAMAAAGALAATAVGTGIIPAAPSHQAGHQGVAAAAAHGAHGAAPDAAAHGSGHGQGHAHGPVAMAAAAAAPDAQGGNDLPATLVDGVYSFDLSVAPVRWTIAPGIEASAMAYNGTVPGPTLRAPAGERIRVNVTNQLGEPTLVHWHGIDLPFEQDGVHGRGVTPIPDGGQHRYEFDLPSEPGTYFYHSHHEPDRQQALGLYGALIVEAREQAPEWDQEHVIQLGEWRVVDGQTVPAMPMEGMEPNVFTLNGKAFPLTAPIKAKVGDKILFRIIGSGQYVHPIHLHGGPFKIVATDGHPVPEAAQLTKDTVLVGPGERYDILWTVTRPGDWLLHCHINHHATNDGTDMGGMTIVIEAEA
jgi:FtsP/CotA-like multicopper oxidase with cupredoxin domain